MKLYNTLTRRVEDFVPYEEKKVRMYTCGPTVYHFAHIGNLRSYIMEDVLEKFLRYEGNDVRRVMNITDVGHLSSDADTGEDKMLKGAKREHKSVMEIAKFYTDAFFEDCKKLNIKIPDVVEPATNCIPEFIKMIEKLLEKDYAYLAGGNVYFDTSKLENYYVFGNHNADDLEVGVREGVEADGNKKNKTDFVLWFTKSKFDDQELKWDSPWGVGYPGWHIECSSISIKHLGEHLDLHCGGIDNAFPHHTNEIAQSEAAFEKKLAKYWIHCNHLTSEGQKISKSLGNGYSLADLAEKGYSPLDFKMWVLQGHYQSERDFSLENLEAARIRRLNWRNRIAKCYQTSANSSTTTSDAIADIIDALDDNLNSPKAFAIIDAVTNDDLDFWQQIDHLFGLGLLSDSPELGSAAKKLLEERQAARVAKDFATSDRLRDELLAQNISVLDSKDGQIWQYAR